MKNLKEALDAHIKEHGVKEVRKFLASYKLPAEVQNDCLPHDPCNANQVWSELQCRCVDDVG